MPELVPLSGSDRTELPSATPAATPLDPSEVITVTVLLRRRAELPSELRRVRLPKQRYAVFAHRDHVSTMRATVYTIWNKWLPASGHALASSCWVPFCHLESEP